LNRLQVKHSFEMPQFKFIICPISLHQCVLVSYIFKKRFTMHHLPKISLFQSFPVLFALMTRKSTDAYKLLFQFVRRVLAPGMSPARIMCDFESALMKAFRETFPGVELRGCWFHYANVSAQQKQSPALSTLSTKFSTHNRTCEMDPSTQEIASK
jgi:hypothetical protein